MKLVDPREDKRVQNQTQNLKTYVFLEETEVRCLSIFAVHSPFNRTIDLTL